jgi:hypothetical protein
MKNGLRGPFFYAWHNLTNNEISCGSELARDGGITFNIGVD